MGNEHHEEQGQEHQEQELVVIVEEEEEEKARCEWDFNLSTVVSSSSCSCSTISDALGAVEFDPSETIIATGGIARKIRFYSLNSLLTKPTSSSSSSSSSSSCSNVSTSTDACQQVGYLDHSTACDYCIYAPAKLSSLRWRPGSGSRVIGTGDYDGVVMEYDLEKQLPIFERDEHGGRRVWSVDYASWGSVLGGSGSDDGTMQLWDPRSGEGGECVAMVKPCLTSTSAVCCVEFSPFGGPFVALGCADRSAYVYDMRMMVDPVYAMEGHGKTVTYVRFVDNVTLVSSSIDGCLKSWNLNDYNYNCNNYKSSRLIRTYKGHVNNRNFVGLSVWRNGGLLGCGSENNKVFVYDRRWGEPIWIRGFGPATGGSDGSYERGFVSCVGWSQMGVDHCTLVAGGSNGALQVFRGKRKVRINS